MPNTWTPGDLHQDTALSGREARRIAQMIVQGSAERRIVPAPSAVLGALSLADARTVRDQVVQAVSASDSPLEVICAHESGEAILLGAACVTNGRARLHGGEDTLRVTALAGVRATRSVLATGNDSAGNATPVLGLLVTREPYGAAEASLEDAVAANAGAVLATVALNGHGGELSLSAGDRRLAIDPVPALAELMLAAGSLLTAAEERSRIVADLSAGGAAAGTFLTVLGTPLGAPFTIEGGQTAHLSAQDTRLLEVKVDLGDLSDWSQLA